MNYSPKKYRDRLEPKPCFSIVLLALFFSVPRLSIQLGGKQAVLHPDVTISKQLRAWVFRSLFISIETTSQKHHTLLTYLPSGFKLVHPWTRHCQCDQNDHGLLGKPSSTFLAIPFNTH